MNGKWNHAFCTDKLPDNLRLINMTDMDRYSFNLPSSYRIVHCISYFEMSISAKQLIVEYCIYSFLSSLIPLFFICFLSFPSLPLLFSLL